MQQKLDEDLIVQVNIIYMEWVTTDQCNLATVTKDNDQLWNTVINCFY